MDTEVYMALWVSGQDGIKWTGLVGNPDWIEAYHQVGSTEGLELRISFIIWMDKDSVLYIHAKEYYLAIKGNSAICDSVDGLWGSYAKWNVRQRKTTTVWAHLYRESKKIPNLQKQRVDWWLPGEGDVGNRWRWSKGLNFQLKDCYILGMWCMALWLIVNDTVLYTWQLLREQILKVKRTCVWIPSPPTS